jgi:hypothetical protein
MPAKSHTQNNQKGDIMKIKYLSLLGILLMPYAAFASACYDFDSNYKTVNVDCNKPLRSAARIDKDDFFSESRHRTRFYIKSDMGIQSTLQNGELEISNNLQGDEIVKPDTAMSFGIGIRQELPTDVFFDIGLKYGKFSGDITSNAENIRAGNNGGPTNLDFQDYHSTSLNGGAFSVSAALGMNVSRYFSWYGGLEGGYRTMQHHVSFDYSSDGQITWQAYDKKFDVGVIFAQTMIGAEIWPIRNFGLYAELGLGASLIGLTGAGQFEFDIDNTQVQEVYDLNRPRIYGTIKGGAKIMF